MWPTWGKERRKKRPSTYWVLVMSKGTALDEPFLYLKFGEVIQQGNLQPLGESPPTVSILAREGSLPPAV